MKDDLTTSCLLEKLAEELEAELNLWLDVREGELVGELPYHEWTTVESIEVYEDRLYACLEAFQQEANVWLDIELNTHLIIRPLI